MNAWAFGGKRFYDLVKLADQTEVNAFVIDVKDDTGYLTYRSEVPTAIEIGANTQRRARDVQERLRVLREHGIHPIARIVVAKDPLLASKKPGMVGPARGRRSLARPARLRLGGCVQRLGLGLRLSTRRRGCAARLCGGAVRLRPVPRRAGVPAGAAPCFPRAGARRDQAPGREPGTSGCSAIAPAAWVCPSRSTCSGSRPARPPTWASARCGRTWSRRPTWCSRWSIPSHYFRGYYNLKHPNSEPYKVIRRAMQDALKRSEPLGKTAEIRPYLQAFTLGQPRYTPGHVREQIRAAEELGIKSWVLWNPRSAYDPAIFRPRDASVGRRGAGQRPVRRRGRIGRTTARRTFTTSHCR